jgi:hypothetical protein
MRKEFVPHEYELILLCHLKRIKQGSKSIQSYHDEFLLLCVGQILSMTWMQNNTSRRVLMLILLLQLRESMLEV